MKALKLILLMILIMGCSPKEKKLHPEKTYIVKHSAGIDTLKARATYSTERHVIFYSDDVFGQSVGKFDAPYSFKTINQ